MAPVTQYVFAETLELPEHFTAGSHKWLPYSDFPTFPKRTAKQQFVYGTTPIYTKLLQKGKGFYDRENCCIGGEFCH